MFWIWSVFWFIRPLTKRTLLLYYFIKHCRKKKSVLKRERKQQKVKLQQKENRPQSLSERWNCLLQKTLWWVLKASAHPFYTFTSVFPSAWLHLLSGLSEPPRPDWHLTFCFTFTPPARMAPQTSTWLISRCNNTFGPKLQNGLKDRHGADIQTAAYIHIQ